MGAPRDALTFTRQWWGETGPLFWIDTAGESYSALRFEGLDVPRGARITEAVLTVWSYNAAVDDPSDYVTIWAEPVDDAAPLEGPADAWERKDRRGRSVRWPTTNTGRGRPQPSPDLSALLQEIVDRPGWSSGNAVLFFAASAPNPAHDGRQMHSFATGAAGSTRPRLEVSYVVGGAPAEAVPVETVAVEPAPAERGSTGAVPTDAAPARGAAAPPGPAPAEAARPDAPPDAARTAPAPTDPADSASAGSAPLGSRVGAMRLTPFDAAGPARPARATRPAGRMELTPATGSAAAGPTAEPSPTPRPAAEDASSAPADPVEPVVVLLGPTCLGVCLPHAP